MSETFETPWHGTESAGRLSLTFLNTLDWRLRASPVELFHSYEDVLRWAWTVGAIERPDARVLRDWALRHPRLARMELAYAIEAREGMATLLVDAMMGRPVQPPVADRFNATCQEGRAAQRLLSKREGWCWDWPADGQAPRRPVWVAALDAAEILTSGDLARVRQCGDAECGWFFFDTSRNGSRRWCSMEACGNRNKARRFYARSSRGARTSSR
jgi:predicted RNA-binding Zn ribbon-like protein